MTTRQLIAQVLLGQRVSVLQKAASDISVLLPLLGAPSSNLQKAAKIIAGLGAAGPGAAAGLGRRAARAGRGARPTSEQEIDTAIKWLRRNAPIYGSATATGVAAHYLTKLLDSLRQNRTSKTR